MSKRQEQKNDRGEYRSIYKALFAGNDFRRLSPDAKLVFFYLKGQLPAPGINSWPLLAGSLADQIDLDVSRVEKALIELEREQWIRHADRVVWVIRGLRFEPGMSAGNENHCKFVRHHIASLPNVPVVRAFREFYAEWFDTSTRKVQESVPVSGENCTENPPATTAGDSKPTEAAYPNPSGTHPEGIPNPSGTHPEGIPNPSGTHPEGIPNPSGTHPEGIPDQTTDKETEKPVDTREVPLLTKRVGDAVASPTMPVGDAEAYTVTVSGNVKRLGDLSTRALERLLPLAQERRNAVLIDAISIVLEARRSFDAITEEAEQPA